MDNFSKHKRVLVTGFRPFRLKGFEMKINASIEAVKLINKMDLERSLDITLETAEVPVEYQYIDNKIPLLWEKFQPDLAIHVGVWDKLNVLKLEKVARKYTYYYEDNIGNTPKNGNNPYPGPKKIATDLPLKSICDRYNSKINDMLLKAEISKDAGMYICEYLCYTSLCLHGDSPKNSLFIHVPAKQTEDEFAALAQGLERIIAICVDHIRNTKQRIMKGASHGKMLPALDSPAVIMPAPACTNVDKVDDVLKFDVQYFLRCPVLM